VSPEAYLRLLAQVVLDLDSGKTPKDLELQPAQMLDARYVSADDPKLWGWVIFPQGFKAPAMMDLAKKQAWTLKPAVLHSN
jgi:hypothetical protein